MNQTTVKLNANLKKEFVMKISHMILTPPEQINILAYFTLTIGSIQTRHWKLKRNNNNNYYITPPSKAFNNTKGNSEYEPVVIILDPKIKDKVLELALIECEVQKEIANANFSH